MAEKKSSLKADESVTPGRVTDDRLYGSCSADEVKGLWKRYGKENVKALGSRRHKMTLGQIAAELA